MYCLIAALIVAVVILGASLVISQLEQSSGLCGSVSFVPGILFIGLILEAVIFLVGFLSGDIGVWIK